MITDLEFKNLPELMSFHDWAKFPFPDITSGLYCSQKAIFQDGRFIGSAMLKLTCEAVLILDPNASKLAKAKAIRESFEELAKEATEKYGLDQVHVFILPENDEYYAEFLKSHFGFKRAQGIPLVLTKE